MSANLKDFLEPSQCIERAPLPVLFSVPAPSFFASVSSIVFPFFESHFTTGTAFRFFVEGAAFAEALAGTEIAPATGVTFSGCFGVLLALPLELEEFVEVVVAAGCGCTVEVASARTVDAVESVRVRALAAAAAAAAAVTAVAVVAVVVVVAADTSRDGVAEVVGVVVVDARPSVVRRASGTLLSFHPDRAASLSYKQYREGKGKNEVRNVKKEL